MFKIYRNTILALALVVVTVQGCSKKEVVELTPEFTLDALTNPSSMDQVEQVLLGAYANFRAANYYGSGSGTGSGWAMMPDVLSDNLYEAIESLANSRTMADLTYDASTGQVAGLFQSPYTVVAVANIVLRDVDKFTTPENQLRANRIKGQAYAIRAMAHFDVFRYFAESFENSASVLAVPYVEEFKVSLDVQPTRLNNEEFYDKVFADLDQAVSLLNNIDQDINEPGTTTRPFIDMPVLNSIRARVYLYAGMWAEAEAAATLVINERPLVNLNQAAYSGMYNETNLGEIIWNIQFDANQGGPTLLVYFATVGRSYFRPTTDIATADGNGGLIRSNDIRYDAFFTVMGGRPAVTKYQGKFGLSDADANFIVFKTGELYLIRAEARARNNKEALANDDLEALRKARITGYTHVDLAGGPLLNAIADERRRELFAEGHRFFDLKRTTRTLNRGPECGNPALTPTSSCSLAPTDREWALPIPEIETNANTNMEQNSGY